MNELWEEMYKIITVILDKLAPMRVSTFRKSRPEWLTAEIMEMMKDRDRALKAAKMTKDLKDKKRARKLRNQLNSIIKLAKNQYMLEKLETYKKDPKNFGKLSKTFFQSPIHHQFYCIMRTEPR